MHAFEHTVGICCLHIIMSLQTWLNHMSNLIYHNSCHVFINTCHGCMVHATTQLVLVVVVVALLVLSLSCQECQRQMHNVWTCIPHFGNTLVIVKWRFDICQIVIMWISFIQMQKISNSCCDRQTKKKKSITLSRLMQRLCIIVHFNIPNKHMQWDFMWAQPLITHMKLKVFYICINCVKI